MNNATPQYETIQKYDRIRGLLEGIALFTKPTTVKRVENVTGKAETFTVETARTEHGDYLFVELSDEDGLTRVAIPPKVTAIIARHSASLTKRNRSRRAKAAMKARGEISPEQLTKMRLGLERYRERKRQEKQSLQ